RQGMGESVGLRVFDAEPKRGPFPEMARQCQTGCAPGAGHIECAVGRAIVDNHNFVHMLRRFGRDPAHVKLLVKYGHHGADSHRTAAWQALSRWESGPTRTKSKPRLRNSSMTRGKASSIPSTPPA